MMKQINNEVMLGGFIAVAGGLLAYMCIAVGGFNMSPGVHVKAKFSNAAGLVKDASIAIAGVEVGHIESLSVEHDHAVVGLFLNKDANVRSDVSALIRAKSLLGEKYLELRPQSKDAPLLKDGDNIESTQTGVEVDELLASLGPVIKKVNPDDVATIVQVVAKTMRDEQGSLASTIHHAGQIAEQVDQMLATNRQNVDDIAKHVASISREGDAMLKTQRPAVERTIAQADRLTNALAKDVPVLTKKAERIASNVDSLTATLNAEAPQLTKDLGATAKRLPGTLDDLAKLTQRVDSTLVKANPLLDKANAFDAEKFRELTENVLLKTGVKIYMHPFNPPDVSDWKKATQNGAQK